MLIGTTSEPDQISEEHAGAFKQELRLDVSRPGFLISIM